MCWQLGCHGNLFAGTPQHVQLHQPAAHKEVFWPLFSMCCEQLTMSSCQGAFTRFCARDVPQAFHCTVADQYEEVIELLPQRSNLIHEVHVLLVGMLHNPSCRPCPFACAYYLLEPLLMDNTPARVASLVHRDAVTTKPSCCCVP